MYQRIVTAVDHVYSGDKTIKATQRLATQDVSITLLHTVRKIPSLSFYYSLIAFNNFEARYSKTIKNKLDYIAAVQDIRCSTVIDFGSSAQALIKKCCEEKNADLVVIKKGRTAKALIQSPPCDMLVLSK